MKNTHRIFYKYSVVWTIVLALLATMSTKAQVTLENNHEIGQEALWFWHEDPDRPGQEDPNRPHKFNQNISLHHNPMQVINGYVFVTWYKGGMNNRNLMLSRMNIATRQWKTIQFSDKNTLYPRSNEFARGGDSHLSTNIGVCPIDGTIHLFYNMHVDDLKYRVSNPGVAFGSDANFRVSNFSNKRNYLEDNRKVVEDVTYPNVEVNNDGEMILEWRQGGSKAGIRRISIYDGNRWSAPKDVMIGRDVNPNFNQYGHFSYQSGKLHLVSSVRIKDNGIARNQGLFYAEAGQRGNVNTWKKLNGNNVSVPITGIDEMNQLFLAEPLPPGNGGMALWPQIAVSNNGAIHMTASAAGRIKHYYTAPGSNRLEEGQGPALVSFSGNDGRIYSVQLVQNRLEIHSTPEGQNNWRMDYRVNNMQFQNIQSDHDNGTIYVLLTEKKSSDKLPIHYYEFKIANGEIIDNQLDICSANAEAGSAENVLDGNLGTSWVAQGNPQSLTLELCENKTITNVKIAFVNGNARRHNFDLQVSANGTNWTNVLVGAISSGNTLALQDFDVADTQGKYLRYIGRDNWNSLTELQVFGETPNAPPVVSFNDPADDLTVAPGYNLYVNVSATDDNSIQKVDLFRDGTLIRTERGAPYEWGHEGRTELNGLASGTYVFTAVATDNNGATAEDSFTLTVNAPPVVSLNDPANDLTVRSGYNLYVNVSATDDNSIQKVDLFRDGTLIRTEGQAPYEWGGDRAELDGLAPGTYVFTAVATDNNGATAEDAFTLTVSAPTTDGGTVSSDGGTTEVSTITGDGQGDEISFTNTSSSSDPYVYLITDESANILTTTSSSYDFEGAAVGVGRVYGLSYIGDLAVEGKNVSDSDLASDEYSLSSNFIEVTREASILITQLGVCGISTSAGSDGSEVLDGSLETRWVAQGNPQSLTIELCEERIITNFRIAFFNGEQRLHHFDLQVSEDGSNWTDVLVGASSSGSTLLPEDFDVPDTRGKYLRYVGRDNWNSVTELQVFGKIPTTDGGTVASDGGTAEVSTVTGDGRTDVISFTNTSSSSDPYVYLITDESGNILTTATSSYDFEGAAVGIGRVYGLSYTGDLSVAGKNISDSNLASIEYSLSSNFIEVDMETSTIVSKLDICGTSATEGASSVASAVDGDLGTRWVARGNPQSLTIELCEERIITNVRIAFL